MDEKLERYKQFLLSWNEKINLIGPEARDHVDDHIAEAVAAADFLKPEGEVLDFGSGGGLPAIPMAIVSPAARFHLVEADQKKWAFLKHVARELELKVLVYGDRLQRALERFPPDLRFNLVVSRAVGKPEGWIPSLKSHLSDGARVALFHGTDEVPSIDHFRHETTYPLPRGEHNRLVVLVFHVEQQ